MMAAGLPHVTRADRRTGVRGSWRPVRRAASAVLAHAPKACETLQSPPAVQRHQVTVHALERRPHRLPDGPQTWMELLVLHESQRKQQMTRSGGRRDFGEAQNLMHMCVTIGVHMHADASPPPPAPPPRDVSARAPLVLLIASHVSDISRVPKLRRCLVSASQQGDAIDQVLLSWSAEPSARRAVCDALAKFAGSWLVTIEQPHAFRQFEHYEALAARLATRPDAARTWVTFTDDDDVLHPQRSAAYAAAIATAADARALGAAWTARPLAREGDSVASPADVDRLVRTGRVVCTPPDAEEVSRRQKGQAWDEYFNYALHLPALLRFFESACLPALRRSRYADLALLHYIRNALPMARFAPSALGFQHCWCHLYDKSMDPQASCPPPPSTYHHPPAQEEAGGPHGVLAVLCFGGGWPESGALAAAATAEESRVRFESSPPVHATPCAAGCGTSDHLLWRHFGGGALPEMTMEPPAAQSANQPAGHSASHVIDRRTAPPRLCLDRPTRSWRRSCVRTSQR